MATTHDADVLSVIHALDDACNAHDLDAVMALFAEDAVVRHTPPPDGVGVYHGTEEIHHWFEPQMPGFHVDSRDQRVEGDTIRWSALTTQDLLRQIGQTEPVPAEAEAVVRAGKIVAFSVTNPTLIGNC